MKIKDQEKVRMQYLAGIITESAMQEEKNRLFSDLKTVDKAADKKNPLVNTGNEDRFRRLLQQNSTLVKALADMDKIDLDGLFTIILQSVKNIDLTEPGMMGKLTAALKKAFNVLNGGAPTEQPTSEPAPEEPTNL